MTSSKTLDWLLVGAGDIAGKRVAEALAGAERSRLVGVCDLNAERAQACAKGHGASEVFTDFDEALARTSAGAVYIATPVFLHAPQAAQALKSGRHVLVEKPLGLDAEDAAQAVAAADASGLHAGCAYYRRCSARYAHAAEMVAAGTFGQIVLVRMTCFSWFNPAKDDPKYWRVIKAKGGGGPLPDVGSHMFDVMIGLLGMPRSVYAKARTTVHDYEVEDSAAVLMEMENGANVVGSFNWNSKTWSHEFEIIGTEAKLKWHPYDAGPVVQTIGREIRNLDLPGAENVHAPLVADFVQAVLDGHEPAVPLAEALKTNRLLDAVYRSAATGAEVAP